MELGFDIDWEELATRAVMLAGLSNEQVNWIHERENTRADRYGYKNEYDTNWLIGAGNIKDLFYGTLKDIKVEKNHIDGIINCIKGQIPKEIAGEGSHSASVAWQHCFDNNVRMNVTLR